MQLHLGVKADPIEYRYSYEWLFRLMRDEGVSHLQIGSFFELYQLADSYFQRLRDLADRYGIRIASMFTAHRELGGFFTGDTDWESVARRNYERFIEVGALLGAEYVGSNPGAVLRDRMDTKPEATACYLRHMKELMAYAHDKGLKALTIEPMSCLAEPPTLPAEMTTMADELGAFHRQHPDSTVPVGFCFDVSHGYADADGIVQYDNMALLEAALPHTYELHLKNTDAVFGSTFGFGEKDRARGIVDVPAVVVRLQARATELPVEALVGYLEIGGPKVGRDYSDHLLEGQLRDSLSYLRGVLASGRK